MNVRAFAGAAVAVALSACASTPPSAGQLGSQSTSASAAPIHRVDTVQGWWHQRLAHAAKNPGGDTVALDEYAEAAERGDVNAQYSLGFMYEVGQGVPRDAARAAEWYSKAAEQGDAEAQSRLGSMYAEGRGVERDDAKAAEWYRRAAENGDGVAQVFLGQMYKEGHGVPQDYVQAYAWFNVAAAQSQTGEGAQGLDVLASQMTPSQLEEAQKLSREYFEKYVAPFRKAE